MFNAFIIDDDPIQLRIAELLFKKSDTFASTSYLNADLALDYLEKNQHNPSCLPDVIFIDLNMPKLDGWGFLNMFGKLLPGMRKAISVFIVTSSIDSRDHNRSNEYEFVDGIITKPITYEKLYAIVNHVDMNSQGLNLNQ
jgi:two-component system, chemotaxis family, chemotaxis protein CheY